MSGEVIEGPASSAAIPWTALFAAEVAIGQDDYLAICARHGVSAAEWGALSQDAEFTSAVEAVRLALRRHPDASFKVKSRLFAESLLPRFRSLIDDDQTPPSVRADLMKYSVKMAGLDASAEQRTAAAAGPPLQININLR
jgi:hypothetical protein